MHGLVAIFGKQTCTEGLCVLAKISTSILELVRNFMFKMNGKFQKSTVKFLQDSPNPQYNRFQVGCHKKKDDEDSCMHARILITFL